MEFSDEDLVQRTLAGDQAAFEQLVRKYQNVMYALACSRLLDAHDAEDVVQEAFVKAYQKLHTLRQPGQFASWLSTITTNACKMWFRDRQRQTRIYREIDKLEVALGHKDAIRVSEDEVNRWETQFTVHQILDRLTEPDRMLLRLFYLNGFSYREIGMLLNAKPNQIKTKLHQARQHFKKEWEKMEKAEQIRSQLGGEFTQKVMKSISGKVVDSTDGNPVASANIYARVSGGRESLLVGETKAEDDGSFRFDVEAIPEEIGGHYELFAVTDGHGVGAFIGYKKSLRDITIPLGPAAGLRGTVVDTNGKPIEGVSLRIYHIRTNELDRWGEYKGFFVCEIPNTTTALTDNNGNFEFRNLPRGTSVNINIRHPKYASETEYRIPVAEGSLRFVLRAGAVVRGQLTYELTCEPAAGFKVVNFDPSHRRGGASAETDENGNYELTGLHPGGYHIRVLPHPDWVAIPTEQIDVPEGGLVEGVDLKLIEGGLITGRVIDADTGKPIKGVGISTIGQANTHSWGDKSNSDGVYRLRAAPGAVWVCIYSDTSEIGYYHPGDRGKQQVKLENGQTLTDVDFKLRRSRKIQGRVVNQNGEPVAGVTVMSRFDARRRALTKSGNSGEFVLEGASPDENVELRVIHKGLGLGETTQVSAGTDEYVTIVLRPCGVLRGRVVDENAQPLPAVRVRLKIFYRFPAENGFFCSSGLVEATLTDEHGRFEFANLIPGADYNVSVESGGFDGVRKGLLATSGVQILDDLVLHTRKM